MARAMEHRAALLLRRLGLDEPHVCPGDCLADLQAVRALPAQARGQNLPLFP
jgi:hypothetical protein